MKGECLIRFAVRDDAAGIASLSGQLGYPTDAAEVGARIELLETRQERQAVLVAVDSAGSAIGYAQIGTVDYVYHEAFAELMGLVVDVAHRGEGVGRRLMEAAESWAAERGLGVLSLRSNVVRAEAHAFYERLGYERVKTQYSYRKALKGRRV